MLRIPARDAIATLERILSARGFSQPRAATCARLFVEATVDGVASHGLNRFARFIGQVDRGIVVPEAEPVLVGAHGAWERWDGQAGPGNLNALASTERAMALARAHGIGCVALANTNHWMRGGSYGWHAAERGMALLAWTNTLPNMPPWGGVEPRLGNNPLVVAVPRGDAPVVLDMAMSQFSYGRMEVAARRGEALPLAGGFDADGLLTTNPTSILRSQRTLPTGYWKGAGLALVLDLLAAMLSGGSATVDIGTRSEETSVSQVFIAVDVTQAGDQASLVQRVLHDLAATTAIDPSQPVRHPGERVLQVRADNLARGVPVDEDVWRAIIGSHGLD